MEELSAKVLQCMVQVPKYVWRWHVKADPYQQVLATRAESTGNEKRKAVRPVSMIYIEITIIARHSIVFKFLNIMSSM